MLIIQLRWLVQRISISQECMDQNSRNLRLWTQLTAEVDQLHIEMLWMTDKSHRISNLQASKTQHAWVAFSHYKNLKCISLNLPCWWCGRSVHKKGFTSTFNPELSLNNGIATWCSIAQQMNSLKFPIMMCRSKAQDYYFCQIRG